MKEALRKNDRAYWLVLLLSIGFALWYAAQVPYTHDDWDWGTVSGLRHFLTADVNSRYAGNLVEILLTRSALLKTLTLGLVIALTPAAAVRFALHGERCDGEGPLCRAVLLMMANLLLLLTHPLIWQQTLGWVAGFSNFAVSALLLCVYHTLLLDGLDASRGSGKAAAAGYFLFGLAIQLFLENITVYVLLVSLAFMLVKLCRRERPAGKFWALLAGNLLGAVLMFSSGIYGELLSTGAAVDNYRKLTFDPHAGLFSVFFSLLKRFLLLYPASLWVASWAPISAVLLLLAIYGLKKRPRRQAVPLALLNALLIAYVLYQRSHGEFGRLMLESERWTNILSALAGLVIGGAVLLELLLFFRSDRRRRRLALFCWLSRPAVMLPMVVINTAEPRSYLTTDVLLMQFTLLLLLWVWPAERQRQRMIAAITAAALLAAAVSIAVPFAAIGRVKREREALIRAAREEQSASLLLPAYPVEYRYLLWVSDPLWPGSGYVPFFREFYGLPESTALWFESWSESPANWENGS